MKRVSWFALLSVVLLALLLAACGEEPEPTTPTTAERALAPGVRTIDLGQPAAGESQPGDCYAVLALAADREADRVYALCTRSDLGLGPAVVVVDGTSGQRLASSKLAGEIDELSYGDDLLALDAKAGRLYVLSKDLGALVVLDAETLEEVGRLAGVSRMAAAPGSGRFYAVTIDALTIHDAGDLSELTVLPAVEEPASTALTELAYNPARDQLIMGNGQGNYDYEAERGVWVLDGEDLTLQTTFPLTSFVSALAADGQADRLYALGGDDQLLSIDGETFEVVESRLDPVAAEGYSVEFFADEATGQLHLLANQHEATYWQVMDGASLESLHRHEEMPKWGATTLDAGGRMLGVAQWGEVLMPYEQESGRAAPGERHLLGTRLMAAAVDPDTGQVYVLDSGGGLTVLEGETLVVVEARPVVLGAEHPGLVWVRDAALVLDPGSRRLFVGDRTQGETLVLDVDTLEAVDGLEVAGPMVVDPGRGRLYVADYHVYAYDAATLETVGAAQGEPAILSQKSSGAIPPCWAVDLLFQGDNLFVEVYCRVSGPASRNESSYSVLDGETLEKLGHIGLGGGTYVDSVVVLPEDGRTVVAYGGGGGCPLSRGPIDYDCRQGLLFYDDDGLERGRIEGLTGRLLGEVSDLPDDGRYLYLQRDRDLLALDPDLGYPHNGVSFQGDLQGSTLDTGREQFYVWGWDKLATLSREQLLNRPSTGLPYEDEIFQLPSPWVAEDDTVFAAIPAHGIYRSTDGGQSWRLASWGLQNYFLDGVDYSPDYGVDATVFVTVSWNLRYRSEDNGEVWRPLGPPRLAFVSDQTGDKELYTVYWDPSLAPLGKPFGYEPQRLTDDPAEDDNPAWSPDGKRLAFQSDRSGNQDLWVVNVDGSQLAPLTSHEADDLLPAWSPDGGRIAFTSLRDGNPEIYVMTAPEPGQPGDESTVRRLTDHPAGDWRPTWSPGGLQVAFASTRDGDNEIYVLYLPLDPDDELPEPFQLTRNEHDDRDPAWFPPAGGIYYLTQPREFFQVARVDPNGTGAGAITGGDYDQSHVAPLNFSQFLYVTEQTGNADIYYMEVSGKRVRRLTGDPSNETAPAWSPLSEPVQLPTPTPVPSPVPTLPPPTAGPTPTPFALPVPSEKAISAANAGQVVTLTCTEVGAANAVAYPADGRLLAVSGYEHFHLLQDRTLEYMTSGPCANPQADMTFNPDGRLLAVVCNDTVEVWDLSECPDEAGECSGHQVLALEGHETSVNTVDFSPDGTLLASGDDDGEMRLWRVSDGALLRNWTAHSYQVDEAKFSPKGGLLATTDSTDTVRLWDVSGCDGGAGGCGALSDLLTGAVLRSDEIEFTLDGEVLVVMESVDMTLWQVSDASLMVEYEPPVWQATFDLSPDGSVIATGGGSEGTVTLWALDDGRVLKHLDAQTDFICDVAFNPADGTLASASRDQTVCVWGIEE